MTAGVDGGDRVASAHERPLVGDDAVVDLPRHARRGVRAQAQTTERDLATGRASVISDSIASSIRNSSGFVIVSENRALISRTITSGSPVQVSGVSPAQGEVAVTLYPDDSRRFLAPKGKLARARVSEPRK